jgi:hypothetical protein
MEKVIKGEVSQSCIATEDGYALESYGRNDVFEGFDGKQVEIIIRAKE